MVAKKIAFKVAESLGCKANQVFMSSTGVIGERLKDELIIAKLPDLKTQLNQKESSIKSSWEKASKAIMTTDTF